MCITSNLSTVPDPTRIQQFLLDNMSFHTRYLFYIHSSLDASSSGILTRLHLPSGRRSNRVRFAAGEDDFRFLVASRLVLGPIGFLFKEYRRLFPGNKASGVLVENFLVIFLISSETVCGDFHLYPQKCTNLLQHAIKQPTVQFVLTSLFMYH